MGFALTHFIHQHSVANIAQVVVVAFVVLVAELVLAPEVVAQVVLMLAQGKKNMFLKYKKT